MHNFRLANIQTGEIVCDPMCGGGSIPIEGALAYSQGFFLAGDNHILAVERAAKNLEVFDRKIQADSLQWDVINIPLKDNSVDVLISDLVSKQDISEWTDAKMYLFEPPTKPCSVTKFES